jgi:hypothetical protein
MSPDMPQKKGRPPKNDILRYGMQACLFDIPVIKLQFGTRGNPILKTEPLPKIRVPDMPKVPKLPDMPIPKMPITKSARDIKVIVKGPKREAEIKISPVKHEADVTVKPISSIPTIRGNGMTLTMVQEAAKSIKKQPEQKTIQELKQEKVKKAKKKLPQGPGDSMMYPPPKHDARSDEWVGKVHVHPVTIAGKKIVSIALKYKAPDYWMRHSADKIKGFLQHADEVQKVLKNPAKRHDGTIKIWKTSEDINLMLIDVPIGGGRRFVIPLDQAKGILDNVNDLTKVFKKYQVKA